MTTFMALYASQAASFDEVREDLERHANSPDGNNAGVVSVVVVNLPTWDEADVVMPDGEIRRVRRWQLVATAIKALVPA